VVDETPIGNFGEIEGPARWIDRAARALHISPEDYITLTYAGLFFEWKEQTGSAAEEMTFKAIGKQRGSGRGVSEIAFHEKASRCQVPF
jgi:adenylate cyclase class 2